MQYTKPPLSFARQIALLESRGMKIPDHERASRYLSHINYFRLPQTAS
jgi:abortive infection bacteriophage resistance protein